MEPYLPFARYRLHHVVLQFVIFIGYFIFMSTILDFNVFESEDKRIPSECKKICHVSLPHRLTSADDVDFFSSPNKTHAVFLKFRRKDFSRLQIQQNDQEILDPVNLVWVDSIKAPFLSFDLGFNVYSFTTLWHNIRHATVVVDSESSKCLQNTSYSCVTKSLATEFLTNVSQSGQSRGMLCYVVNDTQTDTVNYNCCQRNSKTHKIECNIPASTGRQMFGVYYTTVAVATIVFVCFPAILCYFPDDEESSQTVKHNTQVRNPLFCLVNYMVQSLRHYSAKYYIVNMTRKLLIGLSLPVLFYIDWGLAFYTAKYDIPKLFNDKVTTYWLRNKHTEVMFGSRKEIVVYSIVVLLFSILPGVNPKTVDLYLNLYYKGVADFEVQWKKPFNLNRKIFLEFCSGFNGLLDDRTSLCKKIGKFVFSCFLTLIILPVIFVLVFIGYGWYVSPLGRQISILLCHAHIYVEWFKQYLKKSKALKWCTKKLSHNQKKICAVVAWVPVCFVFISALIAITMAVSTILSHSLLLISRLIAYLFLGIMASKGVFLPPIVLFSLFVWHIWKCLSSVGNTYTELLVLTFEKCKEYEDENKQVIIIEKKGHAPRIRKLSDLFQNVVDEILPFSKAYTRMCLQIALIWCFLLLTYYAIMTYSKTILDKYTETIAVALTGLIPHLFAMLQCGNSKVLKDKENEFIIKNIVYDFFDSSNAVLVKDVGVQTDVDSGHEGLHQSAARLLSNLSDSSSQEPQASHELEVHVDVNPNKPLYCRVSTRSTREEVDINYESSI